jgi:hypothetical protein
MPGQLGAGNVAGPRVSDKTALICITALMKPKPSPLTAAETAARL